jgi:hypothetical protein
VTRRYIIGSPSHHGHPLRSTTVGPKPITKDTVRFVDDKGVRVSMLAWPVVRGVVSVKGAPGFVARETDDPALIVQIDAAQAAVDAARAVLAEARKAQAETLALLAPRCKPARVRTDDEAAS